MPVVRAVVELFRVLVAGGTRRARVDDARRRRARTREQSPRERTPRHESHALVQAERNHLALLLPIDEVVMILHPHESCPAATFRRRERLRHPPRRARAGAEITHLSPAP